MVHPEAVAAAGAEESTEFSGVVPVYPSVEGLSQKALRRMMGDIVAAVIDGVEETLPSEMARRHGLPGLGESLRLLHRPGSSIPAAQLNSWDSPWHRRLIFEELLILQLGLGRRRRRNRGARGKVRELRKDGLVRSLEKSLPFSLTEAQKRVYGEIAGDMLSREVMHRLLQGDVGSGKTIVAAMACLLAAGNGVQSALMAPTGILAEQHYLTLRALTEPIGLEIALLTAGRPIDERRAVLGRLARGEVSLVVGTHALIQGGVRFSRLGLAVIDEQHRFGVRQRLALGKKGDRPDLLVMTATPIPRTLALTLYGDYDCSVLDAMPPGRRPVATAVREEDDRPLVYEEVRRELSRGNRVFVVLPRIEESGATDLKAVRETARHLQREVFGDWSVGMLHGRMALEERAETMEKFRSGGISILVATTVVEVGVDVPEATVMIVEHADRFGLAQLHQLRGRIGRGEEPSTCFLMAGPAAGEEGRRRLATMAATVDGFRIAEEDLALRGPGEFLGTRQSGIPELRVADPLRDRDLLIRARDEAAGIIEEDQELRASENLLLREGVNARWGG
jgi:ATP-dependent DNA helicase RecG